MLKLASLTERMLIKREVIKFGGIPNNGRAIIAISPMRVATRLSMIIRLSESAS